MAEGIEKVQISPSGEKGTFVGLPLKPMEKATVASIVGNKGNYKLLIEKADVVKAEYEEWKEGGEKLLVKLHVPVKASDTVDKMMKIGMDHHLIVKEGDLTAIMSAICKYMGIEKVTIF